jgi:peptide subunit release factor RF-3
MKQLQAESVVQVLHSERRGPVLAAVGLLQFDIAVDRLAADSGSKVLLENLPRTVVRRLDDPAHRSLLEGSSECECSPERTAACSRCSPTGPRWRCCGAGIRN